jgi:hypothetical protein
MNLNRREFGKRSLATVATMALAGTGLTGCTVLAKVNQSVLGTLLSAVESGVTSLLTYLGNSSAAQEAQTLFNTAINEVKSWVSGTPATVVIEALNAAVAFVAVIPGISQYAALVQLIVGTVDSIISLFSANSPTTAAIRPRTAVATVTLTNPPRKASEFRSQWNTKVRALNLETLVLN